MDPDECLEELRDLAEVVANEIRKEDGDNTIIRDEAERLTDVVKNLDQWIMNSSALPMEWARRCNSGLLHRAELAKRVYDEALSHTETFDGDLGVQLAYLFGAILNGTSITLCSDVVEEVEVQQLLETMFPRPHPVWEYIKTDP